MAWGSFWQKIIDAGFWIILQENVQFRSQVFGQTLSLQICCFMDVPLQVTRVLPLRIQGFVPCSRLRTAARVVAGLRATSTRHGGQMVSHLQCTVRVKRDTGVSVAGLHRVCFLSFWVRGYVLFLFFWLYFLRCMFGRVRPLFDNL